MLASTARRLSQAAAAQAHYSSNLQQLLRGAMVCCSPSSSSSSSGIGNVVVGVASTSAPTTHSFASAPAELAPRPYDVPEGHAKSDLSPHVCNIGLNRRRDLTLRADVLLYGKQASGTSLASLFKVRRESERDQTSYFFVFPFSFAPIRTRFFSISRFAFEAFHLLEVVLMTTARLSSELSRSSDPRA